ncbi:unnamed protein product [Phytophthora fragariaefolia]|uniref:Unnamed protein product n=1 Tax=Phytophthora fragariaefolia TaxID=1490495 RepID=A0A9W6X8D7_9STRA|nr:unnamed protein product [Phytophthora fragariaefolia]
MDGHGKKAVLRVLRTNANHANKGEDGEERAFEALLKFDFKKLDDLRPQKEIEMINLKKLDDVIDAKKLDSVVDTKKIDDIIDAKKLDDVTSGERKELDAQFAFLFDDIIPGWKREKFTPDQIRKELTDAGIKDEKAISTVLAWAKRDVRTLDDVIDTKKIDDIIAKDTRIQQHVKHTHICSCSQGQIAE